MTCWDALYPVGYCLLSIIGLALSAIIVDTILAKGISIDNDSEYVFASVTLAVSSVGLVAGVVATVLACRREKDASLIRTTNDFKEGLLNVLGLAIGGLILALAALVVKIGTPAVSSSSFTFAIAVLALSGASIIISLATVLVNCAKSCETRVEVR